jgi:hypothetical protein
VAREEDRRKFVDLASKRVNRTLKDIQLIGNLSNRSNYDYTDQDVAKIFKALADEIAVCRKRFEQASRKAADSLFVLD